MNASTRTRRLTAAVSLAAVLLAAAGCGTAASGHRAGHSPTPTHPAPTGSTSLIVAKGHGWTSAGLEGPMPAPGSCHTGTASDGEPLPDPKCTPGAIDAAVTDANISSTVCRKGGYTKSVRPPVSLTDPAKKKLMAAYGLDESKIGQYELDHFVALNDGGASDLRNLWPEPNTTTQYQKSTYVQNDKDAVEDYTYRAICDHKVTVSAVQQAIAADWTTAVARLGLPPIPSGYRG